MRTKARDPKPTGYNQSKSKRAFHSNTTVFQEKIILNKQSKLTPKANRERTKPKVSRRKEIIKVRAEISEKEMKDYSKAGPLRR